MKKAYILTLINIVLLVLVASCSKDDEDVDVDIRHYTPNTKYTTRLEVPKLLSQGTQFIQHSTVIGSDSVMTYCLEYDYLKNHSRWVAFRFDGLTRGKSAPRSTQWMDDPDLAENYQIGGGAFRGGVRGHLCASYDRRYSTQAETQTFYMTNMSPMNYDFNGTYWSKYESYVQNIGRNTSFADTLYVVKGGTIRDGQTQGYAYSSGGKAVPIPSYYFIALLRLKGGQYSAMGFWVQHRETGTSVPNISSDAVTIDYLEQQTSIDFFPNLPDDVETKVEKSFNSADWNL